MAADTVNEGMLSMLILSVGINKSTITRRIKRSIERSSMLVE